jgi:hypothetical protein
VIAGNPVAGEKIWLLSPAGVFETFRRCYQYPDSATMQAVADLAAIPEKRTPKRTHLGHIENGVASINRSDAVA